MLECLVNRLLECSNVQLLIFAGPMRTLAISDIHGCYLSFRKMIEEVLVLETSDKLVLCGDFIDRGPDVRGLIDYIMALQKQGFQIETLKGNHEVFLLNALAGRNAQTPIWLKHGGKATLASYGVKHAPQIPLEHIQFFENLKLTAEIDEYIFVHAAVGTGGLPPLKDERAILWTRNWYPDLDYDWLGDRYIIHGHTPQPDFEIVHMLDQFEEERVINIDGGCVYTNPQSLLGKLCAIDLSNRTLHFQEYVG